MWDSNMMAVRAVMTTAVAKLVSTHTCYTAQYLVGPGPGQTLCCTAEVFPGRDYPRMQVRICLCLQAMHHRYDQVLPVPAMPHNTVVALAIMLCTWFLTCTCCSRSPAPSWPDHQRMRCRSLRMHIATAVNGRRSSEYTRTRTVAPVCTIRAACGTGACIQQPPLDESSSCRCRWCAFCSSSMFMPTSNDAEQHSRG
jgi:hypothetical protein